jgi:RHS repeat-associated protein
MGIRDISIGLRHSTHDGRTIVLVADAPTVPAQYRDATYFNHYNHRGDVLAVTDDAGTLVWQCDYDAFGLPLTLDPAPLSPRFSFSTKRYFAELGTYYYGYRWYLPELCRWMQKDPIGLREGPNVYGFCRNSPTTFCDEYGELLLSILAAPLTIAFRSEVCLTLVHYGAETAITPFPGLEVSYYGDVFDELGDAAQYVLVKHEQLHQRNPVLQGETRAHQDSWIRALSILVSGSFGRRPLTPDDRIQLCAIVATSEIELKRWLRMGEHGFDVWATQAYKQVLSGQLTWYQCGLVSGVHN